MAKSRAAQVAYNAQASGFDNVVMARRLVLLSVVCAGAWVAVVGGQLGGGVGSVSSSTASLGNSQKEQQSPGAAGTAGVGMVFKALKDFLSLEDTVTKLFSARIPAERLFAALRRSDLGIVHVLADAAQVAHEGLGGVEGREEEQEAARAVAVVVVDGGWWQGVAAPEVAAPEMAAPENMV